MKKRIRHRTEDRDNPCQSMPCPECQRCPDCNVCLCSVDFDDDDSRGAYIERVREGEWRRCVAELRSIAESSEKCGKEEKNTEMRKVFERSAKHTRSNAEWLWKRGGFR